MPKLYRIKLSQEEREELTSLTLRKRAAAHKVCKAKSLLLSDEGDYGPALSDEMVASKTCIVLKTLELLRKRCHEVGPMESLEVIPRERPPRRPALNDEQEAQLVRLACSEPPEGCAKWTLRLFAGMLVELEIVESISPETVRNVLKKTTSNGGSFRRRAMRPSARRWKMSWKFINVRMIPPALWCVLMDFPNSSYHITAILCLENPAL